MEPLTIFKPKISRKAILNYPAHLLGWALALLLPFCQPAQAKDSFVGDAWAWALGQVSETTSGTLTCSKTQLSPAPVSGTASQVDLIITVSVSTTGCFTGITVSGSGMSLANGITSVCASATGVQQLHIPVQYDGSALGTLSFTIVSAGSCTADLTKGPTQAIMPIWTLDCVPTAGPDLK